MATHRHAAPDVTSAALETLVRAHRELRDFVERRVGNRADAEDIVQGALVTALEKGHTIRDATRVSAWMYRTLRNRIADHFRAHAAQERAQAAHGAEHTEEPDQELDRTVCGCVLALLDTLKPEYARILRRTELDGLDPAQVAGELGISPNNAAVRAHRAREALRKQVLLSCRTCAEHGCLDCTCSSRGAGSGV